MSYQCIKCESDSKHFQTGKDPIRDRLRDCENFSEGLLQALAANASNQVKENSWPGHLYSQLLFTVSISPRSQNK